MSKLKQSLATRFELALMGKTQEVYSDDEVQMMFKHIKNACGFEKQYNDINVLEDRIRKYTKTNKVTHIDTYRLYGMPCICFCIANDDPEEGIPAPFTEDYGTGCPCAFSYVFNLADDMMCSEFGDVFFRKRADGFYHVAS